MLAAHSIDSSSATSERPGAQVVSFSPELWVPNGNGGELARHARPGRGLVVNDEIEVRHWMCIRRNFGSGRGTHDIGEASGQSRGSGGLSKGGLGKRTDRMREPGRGQESKRGQRRKFSSMTVGIRYMGRFPLLLSHLYVYCSHSI